MEGHFAMDGELSLIISVLELTVAIPSAIMPSLQATLHRLNPRLWVTPALVLVNVLVFVAMLFSGAEFWHSSNGVQLAWGANFGPATQDGEWWRLGSALFLHFGAVHLVLNMWALSDGGQWVERMYGRLPFVTIYFVAGLSGNLLSLVVQSGRAVSGGASGAVFGVYGALLAYLWCQRSSIETTEFRWLFWGALGFSAVSIGFGILVPGIDNAAHIGGLLSGLLVGLFFLQRYQWQTALILIVSLAFLILLIPQPSYRWSEELKARQEIGNFLREDRAISNDWLRLLQDGKQGRLSFDELAEKIDAAIAEPYEENFEELSALANSADLPSASAIASLTRYAGQRRDASRALAEGLRARDSAKIENALEQAGLSARRP